MVNIAKSAVDTLRNQGRAFMAGGIPPAQINLNTIIQIFII